MQIINHLLVKSVYLISNTLFHFRRHMRKYGAVTNMLLLGLGLLAFKRSTTVKLSHGK